MRVIETGHAEPRESVDFPAIALTFGYNRILAMPGT